MKTNIFRTNMVVICVVSLTSIKAAPADPRWHMVEQPNGITLQLRLMGDEYFHYWINRSGQTLVQNEDGCWEVTAPIPMPIEAQERRAFDQAECAQRAASIRKGIKGNPTLTKGVVILANFQDRVFDSTNTKAGFQAMMMDDNYAYHPEYPGSVHKYFVDQSNGLYNPTFTVVGPITLSKNHTYYAGVNGMDNVDEMIKEACQLADDSLDFSQYDMNSDGKVDFVFVIFAGQDRADAVCMDCVWSCSSSLPTSGSNSCKCDGKKISQYSCSSEVKWDGERSGIGCFCHEFSHILGLPDYYDVCYGDNYDQNLTPTFFQLMDWGLYNGDTYCPPNYSAYDKFFMGWVNPKILNAPEEVTLLADGQCRQITQTGDSAKYNQKDDVYYLENRQKVGWDKEIPDSGMLVWRIHYNPNLWNHNEVNAGLHNEEFSPSYNTKGEIHYELVSANGQHISTPEPGTAFPGADNITSFTPFANYSLTDITHKDGVVTFKFMNTTAIENVNEDSQKSKVDSQKYLRDGILLIERKGVYYNAQGVIVE